MWTCDLNYNNQLIALWQKKSIVSVISIFPIFSWVFDLVLLRNHDIVSIVKNAFRKRHSVQFRGIHCYAHDSITRSGIYSTSMFDMLSS